MTINNTVQGRRRVLLCDFSLETPRTCEGVERGVLGTGEAQWSDEGSAEDIQGWGSGDNSSEKQAQGFWSWGARGFQGLGYHGRGSRVRKALLKSQG